ncbi:hypothetical protein [Streptomyces sp. NPDC127100]|uniref:hypothetical protein n=1 Tax=Streptomyces sp. NPDC127100 TaxID=3347138 RepID=UPI003666CD91
MPQPPAAAHDIAVAVQDGRLLIAVLDPGSTPATSPLRRALAHPHTTDTPETTADKEA